ncbi:MAG TPA: response regulator transcription factor [Candidatus Methylomirabilis sp.]|nr:response regulator transcription factor [Candidatus Methylomirabilis sp.]
MVRIIIADDHPVVRRGLRQILAEEADMRVVGEAQNAEELLALVRKQGCEVLVTDISMPGRSGLEALKEVKHEYPKLPVLVMSVYSEDQFGVQALKLGASGYLNKGNVTEELVQAIRKVVTGGRHITAALAEKLASHLVTETDRPLHQILSVREHQFLCMLGMGKSLKEIAQELDLSVQTISTFRNRTLEKMGMKSNAQLVHYAVSHRLLDRVTPAPSTGFSGGSATSGLTSLRQSPWQLLNPKQITSGGSGAIAP